VGRLWLGVILSLHFMKALISWLVAVTALVVSNVAECAIGPDSPFTITLKTNVDAAGWRNGLGTVSSTGAVFSGSAHFQTNLTGQALVFNSSHQLLLGTGNGRVYAANGTELLLSTNGGNTFYTIGDITPDSYIIVFSGISGVVGFTVSNSVYWSANGVDFTQSDTSSFGDVKAPLTHGIDEHNGVIVFGEYGQDVGATGDYRIFRSADGGQTWTNPYTLSNPTEIRHWHTVNWLSTAGKFLATSGDSDGAMGWYTSPTGVTWTPETSIPSTQPYRTLNVVERDDGKIMWGSDTATTPAIYAAYFTNVVGTVSTLYDLPHACWGIQRVGNEWWAITSVESGDADLNASIHFSEDGNSWSPYRYWGLESPATSGGFRTIAYLPGFERLTFNTATLTNIPATHQFLFAQIGFVTLSASSAIVDTLTVNSYGTGISASTSNNYLGGLKLGVDTSAPETALQYTGDNPLATLKDTDINILTNLHPLGQIIFSGSDGSSNAAGPYVALVGYALDSSPPFQESAGEGGGFGVNIYRCGASSAVRTNWTAFFVDQNGNVSINGAFTLDGSMASSSTGLITFNDDSNGDNRDFIQMLGGYQRHLAKFYRNTAHSAPVVIIHSDNASATGDLLSITNDGSGAPIRVTDGTVNSFAVLDGGMVFSAGSYSFPTNVLTTTNAIDVAVPYKLILAAGTISISNFVNTSTTEVRHTILRIDANGSDRIFRVPDNCTTTDGLRVYTVTNGTVRRVEFEVYANQYTNLLKNETFY